MRVWSHTLQPRKETTRLPASEGGRMATWQLLLAPASALAGVWISPLLSARKERRAWLWSKQYEAAAAVTTAARTVLWRGDEIDPSRTDQPFERQKQAVRLAMFDLREQLALIELLFQGGVANAAKELEGIFGNDLVPYFLTLKGKPGTDDAQISAARQKMVAFQIASRNHLLQ